MLLGYPRINIAEIKRLYRPGPYRVFFDDAERAMRSEMLPQEGVRTFHGIYFITCGSDPGQSTRYSIRKQDLITGEITTLGRYREHTSFTRAKAALVVHLKAMEEEDACASTT